MLGVLFYMIVLAPERRQRKVHAELLKNLKKNDRVLTSGGIYGAVVNIQGDDVTLRIDEGTNTRVRVARSFILRVLSDEPAEKSGDKSAE